MGADVCSERGVQAVLRVRAVGVGSPENGQITVIDDLAAFARRRWERELGTVHLRIGCVSLSAFEVDSGHGRSLSAVNTR